MVNSQLLCFGCSCCPPPPPPSTETKYSLKALTTSKRSLKYCKLKLPCELRHRRTNFHIDDLLDRLVAIPSLICFNSVAVMLNLTFFLRILYASQSVGFIVKQAYFRVTFRHQLSNLCSDNMWFLVFGLGWFDRHALVENVKEKLVKRRQLIVDVVENIDSVKGGLRDVFAKGLSVKVLKTTSRYGRRNRFWTLQS